MGESHVVFRQAAKAVAALPNNKLVSTINGTGAVIESIYVLIFIAFAPKKDKKISALLLLVLTVFAAGSANLKTDQDENVPWIKSVR
ncbi:hypothetical protein RND71_003212 [Anisodus tanguticus]|uniref:Uncharacterized protein n=1 Tax=Anisodus tanguticus TaxID=243964 RepID=A0AAE1VTZ9_9SOLA|nr:hypothetical protein RND71_003212 [Anisodus tanguticus]